MTGSPHSLQVGSSPLTRGKLGDARIGFLPCRLIPTHAGKTSPSPEPSPSSRAHPHSRGENSYAATIVACFAGSSPLTRGKLAPYELLDYFTGLIPTHAGKTFAISPRRSCSRAHPHSRGEN